MNIKISDNWLKEYLVTKASPEIISKELSLSGPSVEKVTKVGKDYVYDIEITANRVDCMSILGIAREASAILPNAKFKTPKPINRTLSTKGKNLLHIKTDPKLVNRVMAVVMEVGEKLETPSWMKERLEVSGMRSLGALVDITNYVMQEIGHPTHVFDYDLINNKQLVFRPSDKGEKVITFDGKTYELPGGDVVIDDGEGEIVDLPGIMGTKNSVVNSQTKKIVFFIDNNDPLRIRKTSTRLGIRTNAAVLNEKGVDPELATLAFNRGVDLYQKICKAKIISRVYDIYPRPYREKVIEIEHAFIEKIIGVKIGPKQIADILTRLGFNVKYDSKKLIYTIKVPSWRANDISIAEDIIEEISRIYGYHNLPSEIMTGGLPAPVLSASFLFENKIKNALKSYGGVETYTVSLVSKELVDKNALALKNPLGDDTKYLRTSLKPSLLLAAEENKGETTPFYLFEVANIYLSRKNDLPEEKMMLGIIFSNYSYRKAKGVVESLLEELNTKDILIGERLTIIKDSDYIYFDIEIETLFKKAKDFPTYVPISKYPDQIEDITLTFPAETKIGEVAKIFASNPEIRECDLKEIYNEDTYTFRVYYQNPKKTLTDKDVEKIRNRYLKEIQKKLGGVVKN